MPTHPSRLVSRLSAGFWIFVVTFAIRLLVLVRFSHSLNFLPEGDDMKFYSDWALRIAHGQWTDHQAFYGLPGYAYGLALIFFVVGGFDPFVVGLIQAMLDAGVAVLIWKICREIFATEKGENENEGRSRVGEVIGLVASMAWALFTPAQAFSTVLMPTIWLVFAYYFCVWTALTTRSPSWWRPWLGMGIFCGFMAMLVATILFATPMLIAAIFRSVGRGQAWRVRAPKIAAAVVTLVAGLYIGAAPAWLHNYFIAHEPVMLSAHSGINFWIGNNPTATGYPKMPPGIRASQEGLLKDSITLAEAGAGRKLTRAEVSHYWSAQANDYISTHFFAWMRLMAVKFGNFWNAYQYDDLSIIKLLRDEGVLPIGLRFGVVAALGLAGLVPVLGRYPRAGWVVAAVLLHLAALLPVFVTERYRLAAVPGLMILGAGGLTIFWHDLSSARWSRATVYVVLCGGAAWFTSLPRSEIGLWSLDYYKAGIRGTTAGELEQEQKNFAAAGRALEVAQRNLELAYAYVPNNPDIDFALGNLWLARANQPATEVHSAGSDRTRAKLYYRRALDLNPRHTGTLNNLGVLAMEEKRWPLAEKFLGAAIESEPTDAKAHYLLARAYFEDRQVENARSEIEAALRLRPGQREFLELQASLSQPMPAVGGP